MPTLGWSGSAAYERRTGHMDRNRSGAEETDVSIIPPKTWTVGVPAVVNPLRYTRERTTVHRTALTLLNLDRAKGFGCPRCAWPEAGPAHRHGNEYCENGAKHMSDEATTGGGHDHAARFLERTTTGAADATAMAPRSDGP